MCLLLFPLPLLFTAAVLQAQHDISTSSVNLEEQFGGVMHFYSRLFLSLSFSLHFQLHKLVHYSCDAFRFRKETTVPSADCRRKFLNEVTERRCKLEIGATGCCCISTEISVFCNQLINLINCVAKLHASRILQVATYFGVQIIISLRGLYLSRRSPSNTSPSSSRWQKQCKRLMNV